MPRYKVYVELIEEYDDIEAETEEEAMEIASDYAVKGGSWYMTTEELEEEDE